MSRIVNTSWTPGNHHGIQQRRSDPSPTWKPATPRNASTSWWCSTTSKSRYPSVKSRPARYMVKWTTWTYTRSHSVPPHSGLWPTRFLANRLLLKYLYLSPTQPTAEKVSHTDMDASSQPLSDRKRVPREPNESPGAKRRRTHLLWYFTPPAPDRQWWPVNTNRPQCKQTLTAAFMHSHLEPDSPLYGHHRCIPYSHGNL